MASARVPPLGWLVSLIPRLVVLLAWGMTSLLNPVFADGILLPLVGIALAPYTTATVIVTYRPGMGIVGWDWCWIALALLLDAATYGTLIAARHRDPDRKSFRVAKGRNKQVESTHGNNTERTDTTITAVRTRSRAASAHSA